jgi:hypothetical protein
VPYVGRDSSSAAGVHAGLFAFGKTNPAKKNLVEQIAGNHGNCAAASWRKAD